MKSYSLLSIFLFVFFIGFTSCVSKKKFAQLETEKTNTVSQKDQEIIKLNRYNDSLKVELVKKDSIIDSLNTKLVEFQTKKEKPKVYSSKKSSNLNKDLEYERKALFLYNFAAYIEWPIIFNGTDFVVGVAGDKNAVNKIQQTIGSKKVGGKKMKVEKYNKVTNYHMVYVTSAQSNDFPSIKNDSKKNSKTILISDDQALFSLGAHISFILDDDKVKYTINKPIIEKTGLKVSQELMRFSE